MKILLDECLPVDFRHGFPSYDVHSTQWAGLKGKKNGDLLQSAEALGYEIFLTVDQGDPVPAGAFWPHDAIVIVRARTNQLEDLRPMVDSILEVLKTIRPSETRAVPNSGPTTP